MYACICNKIGEILARKAIADAEVGAPGKKADKVDAIRAMKKIGKKPVCGKCLGTSWVELIDQVREENAAGR